MLIYNTHRANELNFFPSPLIPIEPFIIGIGISKYMIEWIIIEVDAKHRVFYFHIQKNILHNKYSDFRNTIIISIGHMSTEKCSIWNAKIVGLLMQKIQFVVRCECQKFQSLASIVVAKGKIIICTF